MSIKSIPVVTCLDYIATDICQSPFYSLRAKILKAISLANVGKMKESYIELEKVIHEKDLPIVWIK